MQMEKFLSCGQMWLQVYEYRKDIAGAVLKAWSLMIVIDALHMLMRVVEALYGKLILLCYYDSTKRCMRENNMARGDARVAAMNEAAKEVLGGRKNGSIMSTTAGGTKMHGVRIERTVNVSLRGGEGSALLEPDAVKKIVILRMSRW
jgi:hypothetical protein